MRYQESLQPPIPTPQKKRARPWAERLTSLPMVLRLMLGLIGLALVGALLLMLPGMSTRPLRFMEAMFTSVSAITVTGLSIFNLAVVLTPLGQATVAILTQVGGIGVMTLTVAIFLLLGRRISLVNRVALRNVLGAIMPGAVLRLLGQVLLGVVSFELLGAVLLFLNWRGEMASDSQALGYALFHAISAFCNAGFDLFSGMPQFPRGVPADGFTLTIFSGLILVGGLGVPVMTDLFSLPRDRRLTLHTRITLVVFAVLILIGGFGIFLAEQILGTHPSIATLPSRFGLAFFQAVSARTGGFMGVSGFSTLSPASQFLLIILMFIGAAPASMGGGITTGTAATLALALWAYLRNQPYPVVWKRAIPLETIRRAAAVLTISMVVVALATWLILISHPQARVVDAVFEVVSAFATCGLTLSFTPHLNDFGLFVIMLVMIWGRLGALSIVVTLSIPTEKPLVSYPEEQILIG